MSKIEHHFKSKEEWLSLRAPNLNSTDIATLFNANPYDTYFQLWHRKKDNYHLDIEETERMLWGNRLEKAIAEGVAEDLKIEVEPFKTYIELKDKKMGSSFDFKTADKGILEIKNVDRYAFSSSWETDEDDIIAPNHIEFQVMTQLLVSGYDYAMICALVGGNELIKTRRNPDDRIFKAIEKKVQEFWQSIEENNEPNPAWEKDYKFVLSLFQKSTDGLILDANETINELINEYSRCKENASFWETNLNSVKAKILKEIGSAEKVKGNNFSISAKMTKETVVQSFVKKPYRNLRITLKGDKDE